MLPKDAIAAESTRRGRADFIAGCIALLSKEPADDALVLALGGPAATAVLEGDPVSQYWLRVWAARGLLWEWDAAATPALVRALTDEHWRVREMAAKVVARNQVGAAFDAVQALCDDPIPRVAQAAERAIRMLVSAGE